MTDGADEHILYDVVSLNELTDPKYGVLLEAVEARLAEFKCKRSTHLENFARSGFRKYEEQGHSRTYVLITPTEDEGVDVPAFFTIGMTVLDLSQVSERLRKRLSGQVTLNVTGAYSIAELARHDDYTNAQLPGEVILDEAKRVIVNAREHVAGRFAVVDCKREVLKALYEPAGFKEIQVAESPSSMEETDFITACCVIKKW